MVLSLLQTLALSCLMLSLVSCGKDDDDTTFVSKSQEIRIEAAKEASALKLNFQTISKSHTWEKRFSEVIIKNLSEEADLSALLDTSISLSDLRSLRCLGYDSATVIEKKRFWVVFMASIAHAESSLNPQTTYREKDGSLSSGLLQIDLASARRHSTPYTGVTLSQQDLFNPTLNLTAGLYIMKHQLEGGINNERADMKGRLFTDRNYYWSVLTYKRELIRKTFIINAHSNLPFCSIGEV